MILTTKEIKSLIQEELNKFLNESNSLDQELKKEIISIFGEKAVSGIDVRSLKLDFLKSMGDFIKENTKYLGDQAESFKKGFHWRIDRDVEREVLGALETFLSLVKTDDMPLDEKRKLDNFEDFSYADEDDIDKHFADVLQQKALEKGAEKYENEGGDQILADIKQIIDITLKLTHDVNEGKRGKPLTYFDIEEDLYYALSLAEDLGYIYDAGDGDTSYYYVNDKLNPHPVLKKYSDQKWNEMQEREDMKELIQTVFDEDRVPDWAILQKEDGTYYWENYEEDPAKEIIMPKHLEDLLDLD